MATHFDDIGPEEMLAQASWLRRLARRIVRDPSVADDVAQDAWVRVLSSDSRPDRVTRGWLSQVVRNLVRSRARSESARRRRELREPDDRESPSADELAERLESLRLLVDVVRALEEPHRSTVLLHFWEHRSIDEIATAHGVTPATVRTRLARAVETLRRQLDARHGGDRGAWMASFAPLCVDEGVLTTAGVVGGVVTVNHMAWFGALAVVLAVLGTVAYRSASPEVRDAQVSGNALPGASESPIDEGPEPVAPALEAPGRGLRLSASVAGTNVGTAVVVKDDVDFRCRVVDESGAPIAGASLGLARGVSVLGGAPTLRHERTVIAATDATGVLRAHLGSSADGGPVSVLVWASGYALREISPTPRMGETIDGGDVVLSPGGLLTGRVVDSDGHPVAGATVGIETLEKPPEAFEADRTRVAHAFREPRTLSDAQGRFRLDGVPLTAFRPVANDGRHFTTIGDVVVLVPWRDHLEVELQFAPAPPRPAIRGIVRDPEGVPVSGAVVRVEVSRTRAVERRSVITDESGKFVAEFVEPPESLILMCDDPQRRWPRSAPVEVVPADEEIQLSFSATRTFDLVVTSSEGAPIETFEATCLAATPGEGDKPAGIPFDFLRGEPRDPRERLDAEPLKTHVGGRARMTAPTVPFLLVVSARGRLATELGPYEPATVPAEIVVRLADLPGIAGRVFDRDGPRAGATVQLLPSAVGSLRVDGLPAFAYANAVDEVSTDSEGRFVLHASRDGRYVVRAILDGMSPSTSDVILVDHRRGTSGLQLRFGFGGAIEGNVVTDPGFPAEARIVVATNGDGRVRSTRSGPAGEFHFAGLTPGRWRVTLAGTEPDPLRPRLHAGTGHLPVNRDVLPWNCLVEEERATRYDVDLRSTRRRAVIVGRLQVRDAPFGSWTAGIDVGMERLEDVVTLAEDGTFRIETDVVAGAWLVVRQSPSSGMGILITPMDLHPGEQSWSVAIDKARLRCSAGDAPVSRSERVVVGVRVDDSTTYLTSCSASTSTTLSVCAGGAHVAWNWFTTPLGLDPSRWSGAVEVTLTPGQTTNVERP